jgi:tetratricopeptide (TPR) repeat protein
MHPDEELLFQYVDRGADPDVAMHVAGCPVCEHEVAALRLFLADVKSETVWADDPSLDSLPQPLATLATKLTRDRAAHEGVAVIEELNMRVLEQLEREPREALLLSSLAIERAHALGAEYPQAIRAQILGTAWKNRANALRHVGEYHQAFEALEEASRAYSASSVSAFDLATVDYVRATTHYFMDHYEEARSLVQRAAAVFREFGDHRRVAHARILEASIAFESGDAARARDIFYELLPEAHADGDRATLARLFSNIAQCYINLGEHTLATTYAHQGLSLYRQLDMTTEAVRAAWILGRLLSVSGREDQARERLDESEREFLRLGMPVEASLVSLDIAELMLAAGQVDAVPPLCRRVIERFVAADLPEKTSLALALATEALRREAAPTDLVAATRILVDTLPTTLTATTLN